MDLIILKINKYFKWIFFFTWGLGVGLDHQSPNHNSLSPEPNEHLENLDDRKGFDFIKKIKDDVKMKN